MAVCIVISCFGNLCYSSLLSPRPERDFPDHPIQQPPTPRQLSKFLAQATPTFPSPARCHGRLHPIVSENPVSNKISYIPLSESRHCAVFLGAGCSVVWHHCMCIKPSKCMGFGTGAAVFFKAMLSIIPDIGFSDDWAFLLNRPRKQAVARGGGHRGRGGR